MQPLMNKRSETLEKIRQEHLPEETTKNYV